MATIGTLAVKVAADTRPFHRSMLQARDELGRFKSAAPSATTSLAKFGKVAGAVGAAVSAVKLVTLAADAETTRVRFETLIGSAERASSVLGDLRQFSTKTPFQFKDLTSASAKLLSFGVSTDDIMKRIKMLGDVASGSGTNVNELASIFGKMKSSGVVALGDLNQLGDRAIPIFETLKKQLGLSGTELRKYVSTGKLGFPQVLEAIQTMTSKGGMFFGAMEKQSQTLAGKWSTLKDNISALGTELGKVLLPILKKVVDGLTFVVRQINKLNNALGEFFGLVKKGGIGSLLGDAAKTKRDAQTVTVAVKQVSDEQKAMIERGKQLTEQFRSPLEQFSSRMAELNKLQEAGVISWKTYRRAAVDAVSTLADFNKQQERARQLQGIAAVVRGSTASFSASQRSQRITTDNAQQRRDERRNKLLAEMNEHLRRERAKPGIELTEVDLNL